MYRKAGVVYNKERIQNELERGGLSKPHLGRFEYGHIVRALLVESDASA